MSHRWLVITTDFRPLRGGIARMVEALVDHAPDTVEWRCVTRAPGPPEPGVYRYPSFVALFWSLPRHIHWLRKGLTRNVVCPHPYLQPPALVARIMAHARLTTIVHGAELVPVRLIHRVALAGLRLSHRVITVSRYSADQMTSTLGVREAKVMIVAPTFGSPWRSSTPPIRRQAGEPLRLVTVSRLADIHKNLQITLRAVSVLMGTGLIGRYQIVGDGHQRAVLESLSRALGIDHLVEFTGALDDAGISPLLARSHLGLFPSSRVDNYFEGFGMVVSELAGAGLPTLVGRSGGTPDACAGEWAIPFDPDDLSACVSWIERLATDEDLRFRLATEAYEWSRDIDTANTADAFAQAIIG